ncbi:ubiquitin-like domain-containing protein [Candidatus Formimonas warabiya]|uniref:G5 domain-containing protein n=1 Tax=Formimonas warabiya TaxID=1761012 RepID=A0A3G1KVK4_FORW1|nr:ubiquitin-like domain-containing protein [Candidatus Formimonas warabiya]ATW26482.1 hypothetical protein DCMF_18545 [Candidatus Formimonas warabiya]
MQYAFAHQGRPRGIVKFIPIFLAVLVVAFGYAAYMVIQKEVTVVVDGVATHVKTFKTDVGSVLEEKNIKLYPKDLVKPELTTQIADGQVINITRAFKVSVHADGKQIDVLTIPATVQSVLSQAHIVLGKKDLVEPSLSAFVDKKTAEITVNRITEEFITQTQPVAFRTEKKDDATLERGIRRIVQQGKDGVKEETIKITYKDGKKIRREIVSTSVIKEPVSQIVAYGVLQFASRGGQRFEFDRALVVRASAYTHTGYRTSLGTNPKVGTVAVDPSVIPLGSKLYIEGYGFGRAEDTGGAIKGNCIDLFLESEREARRWGRRSVKIYVLN